MNEFYNFEDNYNKKEGRWWKFVVIAVVFLLIGAIGMNYISQSLLKSGYKVDDLSQKEPDYVEKEDDKSEDKPEEKEESPSLGSQGDLFIKSDNPVVDIAEKVGPAVVGITNKSIITQANPFFGGTTETPKEGYGSGIVISEEGYIVTNSHVVSNADEIIVILKGGKEVKAKLVGNDPVTDVAVIKIDESGLVVAGLGDSDLVRQGELAIAIGNPLGHTLAGTVTVGVISAVDREIRYGQHTYTMLQTDAAINPGNSGGALVDSKGQIIGMNTMKTYAEGLGFAIPTNVFMPIVKELIEKGGIERPGIGVMISEISEELQEEYGFPKGVMIEMINPGGSAEKAGLLPKDIIVGVQDVEITTIDELKKEISKYKVGEIVKFQIWRDNLTFNVPLKLQQLEG